LILNIKIERKASEVNNPKSCMNYYDTQNHILHLYRLTAFVLRTYAQARRYIFVDENDIKQTRNWLLSLQNDDGCFKELGMVHHKEMKVSKLTE